MTLVWFYNITHNPQSQQEHIQGIECQLWHVKKNICSVNTFFLDTLSVLCCYMSVIFQYANFFKYGKL